MQPVSATPASVSIPARNGSGLPYVPALSSLARTTTAPTLQHAITSADAAVLAAIDELSTGQPHAALALLDIVWPSVALDERAWVTRVGALLQMARFVDASGVAARALADLPRSIALRILFADAAQQLGEPRLAMQALRDAAEIAPESELIHDRIMLIASAPMQHSPVPFGAVLAAIPPNVGREVTPEAVVQATPPAWLFGQALVRSMGSPDAAATFRGTLRFAVVCTGLILAISGDRVAGVGLMVVAVGWPFWRRAMPLRGTR